MSLKKDINIKDSKELKDYKVATQADSAAAEDIKADPNYDEFKDNVTEYKTYDQALLDQLRPQPPQDAVDIEIAYRGGWDFSAEDFDRTLERMGSIGREEGIGAMAVATVRRE